MLDIILCIYREQSGNKDKVNTEGNILVRLLFSANTGRVNVSLVQQSSAIETIFGGKLKLPAYNKSNKIVDYIRNISDSVKEVVQVIADNHDMKNKYISSMLGHNSNIVEYDFTNYSKISFIYGADNFSCLVIISLGKFESYVQLF